jgi:hypothetical protein
MADTKISALTAASALAAADIAPLVQGGANVKATVQQIVTAATGSTAFRGETLTTSKPAVDLAQTWNASGTAFTGVKFNATDTASAAGSLLMDLQVGVTSRARVTKTGALEARSLTLLNGTGGNDTGCAITRDHSSGARVLISGGLGVGLYNSPNVPASIASGGGIGFTNNGSSTGFVDAVFHRDATATIAQRNGTNAQTLRVYNTFTDQSNYERGFMRWNSNVLEIGAEGAGTGLSRGLSIGKGLAGLNRNIRFFEGGRGQLDLISGPVDGGDPYLLASGSSQHLLLGASATVRVISTFAIGSAAGAALTISAPTQQAPIAINSSTFNGLTTTLSMGGRASDGTDDAQGDFVIKSNDRAANSFVNFPSAGRVILRGGNGASNATTQAANGGDVTIRGGTGYGTGRNGLVIMDNLPTSNPAVAGALWNNSGVLSISAG